MFLFNFLKLNLIKLILEIKCELYLIYVLNFLYIYTVKPLVTDTSVRRTTLLSGHFLLVPMLLH